MLTVRTRGAVSLMVMIPAFQAGGPGSIPGRRIATIFATIFAALLYWWLQSFGRWGVPHTTVNRRF